MTILADVIPSNNNDARESAAFLFTFIYLNRNFGLNMHTSIENFPGEQLSE